MSTVHRLTPHFTLHEFCHSRTAALRGIPNRPTASVLDNLKRLARALETIREHAVDGAPIIVSSGYRCPELNAAVGGVPTSNHVLGRAADIICPRFENDALFDRIRRIGPRSYGGSGRLECWDELIEECNSWVHFAIAPATDTGRQKTLHSTRRPGGGMRYEPAGPLLPLPTTRPIAVVD